uniref:Uncharacterized protein n=1 Tax=Strigops habroptila TaxID=2489341 RepID=A0A672V3I1_STRHB
KKILFLLNTGSPKSSGEPQSPLYQEKPFGPFPPAWLSLHISGVQNSQSMPQVRLWQAGTRAHEGGFTKLQASA